MKIVHIHTDYKFVYNSELFEGSCFSNTSIIIDGDHKASERDSRLLIFGRNKVDIQEIIKLCSLADLVVLHDLDAIKIKIALALPKEVKVAWRFFGHELYGKRPDLFKSQLSRKFDSPLMKTRIRKGLSNIYQVIKNRKTNSQRFNEILNRIDYFLALSKQEYDFLKQYWQNLPVFIRLPHFFTDMKDLEVDFEAKERSEPIVIIGNNRSSYNNHLDLINIVDQYCVDPSYNFTLFFNYGNQGRYADEVIKRVNGKNNYAVIKDFLNKDDFINFYKKATVLVINGYRQMAGANIRIALEHGVKIYLNNRNPHKMFLEDSGFKIFSIEDFKNDLKNKNLGVDIKTGLNNFQNLKRFNESYSVEDFQRLVFNFLTDKKAN